MKKFLSLLLSFILLFIFITPVFAEETDETYYIIMYTKPSYKGTPYEELFSDHREFLNRNNYNIKKINSISLIAAYRDDNPEHAPPYYVICIEIPAKNLAEASFLALNLFFTGISANVRAMDLQGYSYFCENFVPYATLPECHFALYTPGDIMCYNEVTASSARTVLRISVGLENYEDYPWLIGDMDRNGKLTASDARTILRISVGLEQYSEFQSD